MGLDESPPSAPALIIYTIGHSNQPMEQFLARLDRHGIQVLADVRSQPYSRYVPHFNRQALEKMVKRQGISYLFLGEELGGRPNGDQFYDEDRKVRYNRVAKAPFFRRGIERLIDEAGEARVAILCSEEDPTQCHRRHLVGRVLAREGVKVWHLRGDDTVEGPDACEPPKETARQLSLFGDPAADQAPAEEAEWKSIRPVLPRRPPNNSSRPSGEWESTG
jgi:uncharacterized protein (DUF488 family)